MATEAPAPRKGSNDFSTVRLLSHVHNPQETETHICIRDVSPEAAAAELHERIRVAAGRETSIGTQMAELFQFASFPTWKYAGSQGNGDGIWLGYACDTPNLLQGARVIAELDFGSSIKVGTQWLKRPDEMRVSGIVSDSNGSPRIVGVLYDLTHGTLRRFNVSIGKQDMLDGQMDDERNSMLHLSPIPSSLGIKRPHAGFITRSMVEITGQSGDYHTEVLDLHAQGEAGSTQTGDWLNFQGTQTPRRMQAFYTYDHFDTATSLTETLFNRKVMVGSVGTDGSGSDSWQIGVPFYVRPTGIVPKLHSALTE